MPRGAMVVGGGVGAALAMALGLSLAAAALLASPASAGLAVDLTVNAPDGGAVVDPAAVGGIPAGYLGAFEAAGRRFGVPWAVLAGIYREECDFGESSLAGCNPPGTENGAGAQGPGQFLPTTWRRTLAPHQLIPPGPPTARDADGYATDGDGDGVADPWDVADAVASSARLLAANGGAADLARAVSAYNHDPAYVEAVLRDAAGYEQQVADAGADPGVSSGAVATVLSFADAQLGLPYQWGGTGPGAWDCSGLVQAAFARVGVTLPHNAEAQYALTAPDSVPLGAVEPGDLVFFGPSLPGIEHVGIVVGSGQMIDAPHSGAVVRIEPYDWEDLIAATRPLDS